MVSSQAERDGCHSRPGGVGSGGGGAGAGEVARGLHRAHGLLGATGSTVIDRGRQQLKQSYEHCVLLALALLKASPQFRAN